MSYSKQRLVGMIKDVKQAMVETGLASATVIKGEDAYIVDPQVVANFVLAQAISDSGQTISDSLDKLLGVAQGLHQIALKIESHN